MTESRKKVVLYVKHHIKRREREEGKKVIYRKTCEMGKTEISLVLARLNETIIMNIARLNGERRRERYDDKKHKNKVRKISNCSITIIS